MTQNQARQASNVYTLRPPTPPTPLDRQFEILYQEYKKCVTLAGGRSRVLVMLMDAVKNDRLRR